MLETGALVAEGDDYTTMAGFLLARFATFPAVGESVEVDGLRFEIAEVLDQRIVTVLVSRIEAGAITL